MPISRERTERRTACKIGSEGEMSADNWAQCPQCKIADTDRAEKLDKAAAEAYGLVSAAAWDELRAEARAFRNSLTDDDRCSTLREDYHVGIQDGEFSVGYRGGCTRCGFLFEYKHEKKIVLDKQKTV